LILTCLRLVNDIESIVIRGQILFTLLQQT
jgi:hypothetical protein